MWQPIVAVAATCQAAAMNRTLLIVLALVAGCSSKDKDKSKATKLATEEQVCDALTPAEVEAETQLKTTARMLPKAGEYGAPSCAWLVSDAPDARGVAVTMFFQDNEADSKEYFAKKLAWVCDGKQVDVAELGDEAAFCGLLWVRQGTSFFSVSPTGGGMTPDEWQSLGPRLARHVLPRLP
jgi:hypothetical protein